MTETSRNRTLIALAMGAVTFVVWLFSVTLVVEFRKEWKSALSAASLVAMTAWVYDWMTEER